MLAERGGSVLVQGATQGSPCHGFPSQVANPLPSGLPYPLGSELLTTGQYLQNLHSSYWRYFGSSEEINQKNGLGFY